MGYKAFKKGMICHGKQYAENTEYEEQGADSCCQAGVMHYCDEPFDVWDYYHVIDDDGEFTEYAEVEPLAEVLTDGNKRATKKLRIGARLSLKDFIKAEIEFVSEKAKQKTGDWSKQAATGDESKQAATGDRSKQAATGDESTQAATGDWSKQAATGDESTQAATGKNCVSAIIGNNGRIKSNVGNWIVLAEWKKRDDDTWYPACVKAGQIDGVTLKADTWYKLENGEFVEVKV